jgi:type I restriction enzyme M protein
VQEAGRYAIHQCKWRRQLSKSKRQNTLLPEHIEKIVDTFKHRKKEEPYSSRFEWKKFEKNDYDLNISRFVSTSLDEQEIDLHSVNKRLVDIDKTIAKARARHNVFLKEIGLPPI